MCWFCPCLLRSFRLFNMWFLFTMLTSLMAPTILQLLAQASPLLSEQRPATFLDPHNPHQPQNLTWVVLDVHEDVLNSTTSIAVPGSWFPDLYFDFGVMMDTVTSPNKPGMNNYQAMRRQPLYVCPGHKKETTHLKKCGGPRSYFCASWDCVSTGQIWWDPPIKNDFIELQRIGPKWYDCFLKKGGGWEPCNPVKISFTIHGKKYKKWQTGVTWGGRVYDLSGDPGNIFTIKLIQTPIKPLIPVGPNNVLTNRKVPPPQPTYTPGKISLAPTGYSSSPSQSHPGNPLWDIIFATYQLVNSTNPNLTTACWFCYNVQPPYYEAVGLVSPYNTSLNDKACRWRHGSQTLQSISGKGTCIGLVPTCYQQYCNTTYSTIDTTLFYIPPIEGWWACSTGLTACAHGHVINTKGFCIMVQVIPRIYIYTEEELYNTHSGSASIRHKREPISTLTIALMVGLGLTGAGTGIASFAHQYTQYHNLRAAIDEDLERIEASLSHLQTSLTSLSEVVLQNRRGLDLLFLKEGGLCVALREECCFYADHSGIVQDSMTKLKEGLNKRKKEREDQGWSGTWHNLSPWLTTLLNASIGPIILLILICTLGPCLFNRFSSFITSKIDSLQTMLLQPQNTPWDLESRGTYQPVSQEDVSNFSITNEEDESVL